MKRYVKEFAADVVEQMEGGKKYADSRTMQDYIDDVNRAVRNAERCLITDTEAVTEILKAHKRYRREVMYGGD